MCAERFEPWRARPVPFWRNGFLPVPETTVIVFVLCVPLRLLMSCIRTTSQKRWSFTGAAKTGNDPHNQELGICLLEDYMHSTASDRDRLLLACAKHTAGHRKYGDHLEAYRRFSEAFAVGA